MMPLPNELDAQPTVLAPDLPLELLSHLRRELLAGNVELDARRSVRTELHEDDSPRGYEGAHALAVDALAPGAAVD